MAAVVWAAVTVAVERVEDAAAVEEAAAEVVAAESSEAPMGGSMLASSLVKLGDDVLMW